jgi:predicted  nucleic acid-binding Zn-ribbon protein
MGRNVAEEKAGTPVAKEADLYSWAVRQAALLREGRLAEIDAAAIAEEIDDVGEEEYHRLESALRVLMLHLLKWDHQPEGRSRSWTLSIQEHRRRAQRQLLRSPGLKSQLDDALTAAYEDARLEAASETGLPMRLFPVTRPFDYAEIMERPIVWPGDET